MNQTVTKTLDLPNLSPAMHELARFMFELGSGMGIDLGTHQTLDLLNSRGTDEMKQHEHWPQSTSDLAKQMRYARHYLPRYGVGIGRVCHSGRQWWRFTYEEPEAP
jgi:hypothetical protein